GYDKVRGTPDDYRNFKRAVNLFIGDRDAQMIVDKMINRQLHKCVTFGAALLSDETEDSYRWMLKAFLKVHQKQPTLALTDQDAALRNVVVTMFPESKHRLCMWHITQKLPGKVLGDLDTDSEFRKEFHKLIWNVHIGPEVFENRWNALITRYNLQDNKWLSYMYAIRDRWIPGYFKEYPMCGLMKTTSRYESSNAFFQIFSHKGNTLVQFMLYFESAMKKQRYTQRVLDNNTKGANPSILTKLPIEKHACDVYTHSIFIEVQYEIYKSLYHVHRLVLNLKTKKALPAHLLEKRHRYGPYIEETDRLAAEVHATIEDCVGLLRSNTNKLTQFLTTVKEMKKQL
nr:hypothetical protein [Tanacetum cinerariifolium]